ncbi:MAG: ATP-binding protein [Cyanobacteriota bacterium]|nr:ATP-binding protein [Cyanobacteriota bacterium]
MIENKVITIDNVTITNCDREQINIPGFIQPHGMLFVLKELDLEIVEVSRNTKIFLGIEPEKLIGKPLSSLLGDRQISFLRKCLNNDFENINPIPIFLEDNFNAILHRNDGLVILEMERRESEQQANFFNFYQLTKGTLSKMQKASSLEELSAVIVREIRNRTRFDRVMVYRFDRDESGFVIAEDKKEDLEPYLGLHYPATDIPLPARRLYKLNFLRLIPDVNYQPVELPANPETNKPFDLSFSVLRSVSPIHIEYLRNMGVVASMSISLVQDGKLWGLIACHHYSPKYVPYEIRTACEFFGQVMSLELASKEENQDIDYKLKLKSIQSQLIDSLSQSEDLGKGLLEDSQNLLDLTGSHGVALLYEGEWTLVGKTPKESEIEDLSEWIEPQIKQNIWTSDCLPSVYPNAENFKDKASGVLALSLTKIQKNYLIWFRPEVWQTVNWAGNPIKGVTVEEDGSFTLSPRQSFDSWKETVKGKSLPWKKCELDSALELKSGILAIVIGKAEKLAEINLELQRSNTELDAFTYIASHDLKEPLRGIHNYSNFLLEDYEGVLDEDGVSKLQSLVRLTQRMEELINALLRYSRLGRSQLAIKPANLNKCIDNIRETLTMSYHDSEWEIVMPRPLPTIECDRVLVEEIFSNLISNALKYNNKPQKLVEVGWLESDSQTKQSQETATQQATFYVKDNGIGIRQKHLDAVFKIFKRLHGPKKYGGGTGAGLTIVKKIVERHGGKIWIESAYGKGTTFYFTL